MTSAAPAAAPEPRATTDTWRPTPAFLRSCVAAAAVVIALVWRRPDVLVLATPLVVVAVWSAIVRPRVTPVVAEQISARTVREGDGVTWRARVAGGR